MDDRRHPLKVDLVHDPVTRGNHINILEGRLSPIDEVKSIVIASVFNGAVLLEGIWRFLSQNYFIEEVRRALQPIITNFLFI